MQKYVHVILTSPYPVIDIARGALKVLDELHRSYRHDLRNLAHIVYSFGPGPFDFREVLLQNLLLVIFEDYTFTESAVLRGSGAHSIPASTYLRHLAFQSGVELSEFSERVWSYLEGRAVRKVAYIRGRSISLSADWWFEEERELVFDPSWFLCLQRHLTLDDFALLQPLLKKNGALDHELLVKLLHLIRNR